MPVSPQSFSSVSYTHLDVYKRQVSKEHRVDPIIQMGLFLDEKGLPACMSLFPGNRSDCMTLKPVMAEVRGNYGLKRLVVVARCV